MNNFFLFTDSKFLHILYSRIFDWTSSSALKTAKSGIFSLCVYTWTFFRRSKAASVNANNKKDGLSINRYILCKQKIFNLFLHRLLLVGFSISLQMYAYFITLFAYPSWIMMIQRLDIPQFYKQ
jgi:hypothetical protein